MINPKQIRDNLYGPCHYDGSGLVVGVSGGADSMLLLDMFVSILGSEQIKVLHLNHSIRGEEALRDQQHVEKYCLEHNISCKVVVRDIPAEARDLGKSLEEAGRIARYQEFELEANNMGYKYIACAHHANDRAETVMMNILRGSGVRGLRGMDFVSGKVIRPLLNVTRQEIMEYVETNNIPYVTDSTNSDNNYRRNALRNDLFKYIEDNYGVDITGRLNALADLAREDSDCLDQMAEELYGQAVQGETANSVILDTNVLEHRPIALVKRVVRIAISKEKGDLVDVTQNHVDSVIGLLDLTGKKVNLPGGIEAAISYRKLSIGTADKEKEESILPTITVEVVDYNPDKASQYRRMNKAPAEGQFLKEMCFDADKVLALGQPEIRHKAPGDKVYLDKVGTKKLKDWMIDNKIPQDNRDKVWVIGCGNRVIALPQYRVFGGLEPGAYTQKVLILRID